jgi:hypothetical protein
MTDGFSSKRFGTRRRSKIETSANKIPATGEGAPAGAMGSPVLPLPKEVTYRPLCGTGCWPATVLGRRPDGSLDIVVECGGIGDPLTLWGIPFTPADIGRSGACFGTS